ncbi:ornithine cyclodeaminase family protein [Rhodobacteraceae bacterium RKSG542]|uniref:ornithine cyclodeaminase family protein n=1 Tax=Pseudovibrio flavus TaxID=2529854 RepID=UPI0012BC2844|nr:ornithine cyclodeaminase family protein [Pseudovibrio flavus]MTI16072.1 ornithine cyclodeaminase family protein [Pseudovibrio flavus]
MKLLDPAATKAALPYPELIEALRDAFRSPCVMPVRHHHDMEVPGESDATLLLMPAWLPGEYYGVKIASVHPGNAERGLPAVAANYLLSNAVTGKALALIDGGELTARRTAAASALASSYLSRKDSKTHLIVGTGRLSYELACAHAAIRPIEKFLVWGRSTQKAQAICERITADLGVEALPVSDLQAACLQADIISAATLSHEPLILGEWLPEGCHVDLVGAFKPDMRESDNVAVRLATLFVDTRGGALKEAGDLAIPLQEGVITADDIIADLYDLTKGTHSGRASDTEITLFKSVGAALEDLAGAVLAYKQVEND